MEMLDPYNETQVEGVVEYAGIRCTALGDDGERLLALGHHAGYAVFRAFDEMMRKYIDPDGLVGGDYFATQRAAEDSMEYSWARFRPGCSPGQTCGELQRCRDAAKHWHVEYVLQGSRDAVAVTVLDCVGE